MVSSMRFIADSPDISSVRIDDSNMAPDRGWTDADEALLQRTVDAAPLSDGLAYPTLYGSTPARHRRTLQAIAGRAREEPRGVCAVDESANVELIDHDSLTPSGGALILPKLFRRRTGCLEARRAGLAGLLVDRLVATAATGRRPASPDAHRRACRGGVEHGRAASRRPLTVDLLDVVSRKAIAAVDGAATMPCAKSGRRRRSSAAATGVAVGGPAEPPWREHVLTREQRTMLGWRCDGARRAGRTCGNARTLCARSFAATAISWDALKRSALQAQDPINPPQPLGQRRLRPVRQ
jgi:hypothetical protein